MNMNMYNMLREERRQELYQEAEQQRRLLGLPRGRQTKYTRDVAKREQTYSLRHLFARKKA
jgi:hypothetical protein